MPVVQLSDWVVTVLAAITALSIGCLAAIKTWTWGISFGWALKHARAYADLIEDGSQHDRDERADLIRRLDGDRRWPGVKSIRWWHADRNSWQRWWDRLFVRTPVFLVEVGIGIIALSAVPAQSAAPHVVAIVLALWMAAYALLLVIEAILWYLVAKDYAQVWGDTKFSHGQEPSRIVGDVRSLMAVFLTAVLACAALVATVSRSAGGFDGIDPGTGWWSDVHAAIAGLYYVLSLMTTIGDNDITPTSDLARASMVLIDVAVLLNITFVVSALAARLQATREK